MSNTTKHKVYLLVECEMDLNCEPDIRKVEALAKDQVECAIMHTADSLKNNVSWFDLGNGGMYVKSTTVLPEEFLEIIDPKERLRRTIARAEQHVAAQPEYKRGILERSGQPTLSKPREPVRNLTLAERLMEAVKRDGERPAIERFQALIDRGAINEEGEVLLKAPKPFGDVEDGHA